MSTNQMEQTETVVGQPTEETANLEASITAVLEASQLLLAVTARAMAVVSDTLTFSQLRLIMMVHHNGPRTASGLARGLRLHPSTVTRAVGKLARAGLLTRRIDPQRHRGTLIVLTPAGQQLVNAVLHRRRDEIAKTVARMSANDRQALLWALGALEQTARSQPNGRLRR